MKKFLLFIWEIVRIVIISLVIVLPIRYYLFQPFIVKGYSMIPNFEHGDYLIVDEISYRFREPKRGEVVVFRYPKDPSQRYIKRIIGLPQETIEIKDNKIVIYKENSEPMILNESNYLPPGVKTQGEVKINLNENEYFVLGDNRKGLSSYDSRSWGALPRKNIIGRVVFRLFPITAWAKISQPEY